jgi:AraC-like DNA-binding protein/mannose-6-phosphate isomerase-like protein (cupin superfamily)
MSNQNYIFTLSPDTFLPYSLKLRNVGSAKYGGDWHSTPHVHNYTELFYIVGGQGQFRIDDELISVSADQLVIVNPNIAHTEVSYDAHPMEYIVIGIEGLELSVDRNSGGRFCIFSFPEDNHALTCMQHILQEMQTRNPHYQTLCQAYMEILVVQLLRDASFSGTSVSADPVNSRQCTMIRRYIDNHYKEPLTLDLLAEKANVNKYYLSHMYKEAYSISPISYMIACRIKEGKRLLADTDLPLSQISSILGFSSPSYFSQSFRKAEGVSPLEYRMAHQRKQ